MTASDDAPLRVLDASALLAVVFGEVGFDAVPLEGSAVSAVNWSEVVQVAARRDADVEGLVDAFAAEGLAVAPFSVRDAEAAAALWPATRAAGLSLADRACLALARSYGVPAFTADRAWGHAVEGIEVVLVR